MHVLTSPVCTIRGAVRNSQLDLEVLIELDNESSMIGIRSSLGLKSLVSHETVPEEPLASTVIWPGGRAAGNGGNTEIGRTYAGREYGRWRGGGIIGLGPQVELIVPEIANDRSKCVDAPENGAGLRGITIPVARKEDVHITIAIARVLSGRLMLDLEVDDIVA